MGLFKYPYTDLNELNLDWVIAKIKYIEQAKNIIYDNSGTGLISNNVQDAINEIVDLISSQGVATWNGRSGIVVPVAGDYNAQMIDYDNTGSGLAATNSQSAIDELAARPLGGVESFNTRTGAVVPAPGDYSAADVTYDNTGSGLLATEAQSAIDEVNNKIPATIVESFNTRSGAVTPAAGDYDASDITYDNTTSGLTATDAQGAIDELDNRLDNLSVAASQVSYDNTQSGLTATDAQAALDEIANDVLSSGVASFNGRTGAVNPQSGDYDLTELGDVAISTPAQDDVLKYDAVSQKWVNGAGGGGGSAPSAWYFESIETVSDNNTTDTFATRLKNLADQVAAKFALLGANERYEINYFYRGTSKSNNLTVSLLSAMGSSERFKNFSIQTDKFEVSDFSISQTLSSCHWYIWRMTTAGNTFVDNSNTTVASELSVELHKWVHN